MQVINLSRLEELLEKFQQLHILVVGDFFLDKYLVIDPQLTETSLETGLDAYQVIEVRQSPGAAGNVAVNLRNLGAKVSAVSVIGDDGNGFELNRELTSIGVDTQGIIQRRDRLTPTYTKPLFRQADGKEIESNRQDIKNHYPTRSEIEDIILDQFNSILPGMDGVVIVDQVPEANYGVVTDRVRRVIMEELTRKVPEASGVHFLVDSRMRIGEFNNIITKPNAREVMQAFQGLSSSENVSDSAIESANKLFQKTGKPVFLTMGAQGICIIHQDGYEIVPAVPVEGEIDVTGAGDSCMAALACTLCSGGSNWEAAFLGNITASITIQQIGTTGIVTPAQIRHRVMNLMN
jgi:rfaE bifunctional protein kinase chain/domain